MKKVCQLHPTNQASFLIRLMRIIGISIFLLLLFAGILADGTLRSILLSAALIFGFLFGIAYTSKVPPEHARDQSVPINNYFQDKPNDSDDASTLVEIDEPIFETWDTKTWSSGLMRYGDHDD